MGIFPPQSVYTNLPAFMFWMLVFFELLWAGVAISPLTG